MIDLHCHILPGIDDGSKDIEQSVQIAKEAQKAGFDTICCSSHYMIPNYVSSKKENEKLLKNLQAKLKKEKVQITLEISNEVYVNENILPLLETETISKIGKTDYLLMELPLLQEIKFLDGILDDLEDNSIRLVLAHPERYQFVQKDPNVLIDLIERGVILQSNYASIIGKYGKGAEKTIIKMLKANMVNVLASDVHRNQSIYTRMDEIRTKLKKVINHDYYEMITETNPRAILENQEIQRLPYKRIKKFFF